MRGRVFFVVFSVALLGLIALAAFRDTQARDYLAIQQQYQSDYPGSNFNVQVQQLFPNFPAAQQGSSFKVERCISCHVPDIGTIGPAQAAQRLASDFFKYEPDANQIAAQYHLSGTHPAFVSANGGNYPASISFGQYGADHFTSYTYVLNGKQQTAKLPGFLPTFLSPAGQSSGQEGIDAIGCIVCHNGARLGLSETEAHQNLIINPVYSFTEGAALYYKNCAQCHGAQGEGGVGPPLSNQDRLGFFNEDYYYRCIEYGLTGFEHLGSVMPNWGSIASDYHADKTVDKVPANPTRVLSEDQINLLVQFIRHWEAYETLP
jgi:Cytochrome C oxidase, cbb3-type, subunit III